MRPGVFRCSGPAALRWRACRHWDPGPLPLWAMWRPGGFCEAVQPWTGPVPVPFHPVGLPTSPLLLITKQRIQDVPGNLERKRPPVVWGSAIPEQSRPPCSP